MPSTPRPFFVAGRAQTTPTVIPVIDKNRGGDAYAVCVPGAEAVDRAIAAAVAATETLRHWPAYKRQDALSTVSRRMRDRAEDLAKVLTIEVGKPINDARTEVARAIETIRIAAEESSRLYGEHLPLDRSPRGENFEAIVRPVPVGPCSFITPFNFPLNLATHKIGPAIAAGCPFILKPDPRTPITSLMLGEMLADAELPPGAWSILPVIDEEAREMLVTDERLRLLSFTGSSHVGWALKAKAGRKKVLLELGGIAACIVDAPIGRADLDRIADRLCHGAFGLAGQSCISVQRILIHAAVYDKVVQALLARVKHWRAGDPRDESTTLGPMISIDAAERVEKWIEEATRAGAKVLCGGQRVGAFVEPTLLVNVPPNVKIATEEVFGPVATVERFETFDEALAMTNATRFGLQAGVFTASLSHAFRAWNTLEVGQVIINDVPTTRIDAMPYGGVKESGLGREGVRYLIREMCELRTMVLRNVGKPRAASGDSKPGNGKKALSDTHYAGDVKTLADTKAPGEE